MQSQTTFFSIRFYLDAYIVIPEIKTMNLIENRRHISFIIMIMIISIQYNGTHETEHLQILMFEHSFHVYPISVIWSAKKTDKKRL